MTRASRTTLALALTVCASVGCTGESGREEGTEVPSLVLEEVARIGALDGEDALGTVSQVVPLDDEIQILESRPPRVLRYARDGSRIGEYGRMGEGPGEMQRPFTAGVTAGEVWIVDGGAREIEVFTPEGEHVTTIAVEVRDPAATVSYASALLENGSVLVGPVSYGIGEIVQGTVDHHVFYRTDREGAVLDTLVRIPIPADDFVMAEYGGGRALMGGHPLRRGASYGYFPDGSGLVVVSGPDELSPDSARYRVRIWNAEGALETDTEIPYSPVSADGWQEREAREMLARTSDDPERRAEVETMLRALRDTWAPRAWYPAVTGVVAGAHGMILVRREEADTASLAWDRLDRSGTPTGRFSVPVGVRVLAVDGDELWALETDELDVPYVVQYRLVER